ncbi:MAG TPA: SAM-dependent methyltransferase [Mycobacteriales bacterium]|nr:SAM-dependent methyltransferase [Mycobacteriales bacterium]
MNGGWIDAAGAPDRKSATAARMYDYYLGGIHNFPADQEAARRVIAQFPFVPVGARANRAFLRRAVRHLADAGIRQFLDIGSGIPTEGNIHEIAQACAPDARVAYVDTDPVAVAESLEILEGNERAVAIRADMRRPQTILAHPDIRALLDLDQPTGLLLAAVLHFVPDDTDAYDLVRTLVAALAPGSYLVVTHGAAEPFASDSEKLRLADDVYRQQTPTLARLRSRSEVERFFAGGVELVDPRVAWLSEWRPDPDDPDECADDPSRSCAWAGVGRIGIS